MGVWGSPGPLPRRPGPLRPAQERLGSRGRQQEGAALRRQAPGDGAKHFLILPVLGILHPFLNERTHGGPTPEKLAWNKRSRGEKGEKEGTGERAGPERGHEARKGQRKGKRKGEWRNPRHRHPDPP